MKRTLKAVLLSICIAALFLTSVSAAEELHWYCKREKGNRQISLPTEFSFMEECKGYFIDRTHGDESEEKVVYLTFDAGYENGNVEKILDIMKKKDVQGAFFILKHLAKANSDLVKRMASEGHLVCNHTAYHKNLCRASKEEIRTEIEGLEQSCREIGVSVAPYFRPPEGSFSKELLQTVAQMGYHTVFWSFAYADWDNQKQPTPARAMACIMENMHNGAVLLLHPTSATNAEILPQLIDTLREQGYRFGTLDELCKGA